MDLDVFWMDVCWSWMVYIYIYICVFFNIPMYTCPYVCIYMIILIYIYIHIHIYIWELIYIWESFCNPREAWESEPCIAMPNIAAAKL